MRYFQPLTTADALAELAAGGEQARVFVGGTDLLVGLRHRTIEPAVLVDIKDVVDVPPPITVDDGGVTIGPTLTMAALAADRQIQEWFPALVEASLTVGSVAIRNRASLVGNLCNGSPAADTAPPLLAHGATVTIASASGLRTASLVDFFLAPRRTLCGAGEMVVSLRLPRPDDGSSSAFKRMTRRRGVDLATVSVAAVVDAEHRVTLGLGAVGPVPLRSGPSAPVDLASPRSLADSLGTLLEVASPIADVRAGRDYREAMLKVLAQRAVVAAADRRSPGRSA